MNVTIVNIYGYCHSDGPIAIVSAGLFSNYLINTVNLRGVIDMVTVSDVYRNDIDCGKYWR